jgi:hypothetical protein
MPLTRDDLVSLVASSEFVDAIVNRFDRCSEEDWAAAVELSALLHNEGAIDVLALAETEPFKTLDTHKFFSAQHFFVAAIPKLEASVDAMMACVSGLVARAGEDLASTLPNVAFRDWCRAKPARAAAVIGKAKAGEAPAMGHLVFALEAANNLEEARGIARAFDDQRRLSALTALGRLKHDGEEAAKTRTLLAALYLVRPADDAQCAALVAASVAIVSMDDALINAEWIDLIERAAAGGGEISHFHSARSLWSQAAPRKNLTLARVLLAPLANVNLTHNGTLREIDAALTYLLSGGGGELAIDFFTEFMSNAEGELELTKFESFISALRRSSPQIQATTLIRWLRSGKKVLCEAVVKLFTAFEDHEKPIEISDDLLMLPAVEQIFVCRKAIGYFFIHPVIAASIVMAFLRVADDNTAKVLERLLDDPLLLNYGGSVADYLKSITEQDRAWERVQAVLKRGETYLEGLRSADEIKELHPSEHQRQIEWMRRADEAAETFKSAQDKSVFLQFVKRSTLLYGRRSVMYVAGPDKTRRAVEMELSSHGYSIEMPRMLMIDPVGLDYVLRVYRTERLAS